MEHLLEIKDLKVEFPSKAGNIHAVNGVNLYVDEGEILGVVGESGCGKRRDFVQCPGACWKRRPLLSAEKYVLMGKIFYIKRIKNSVK